MSKVVLITGCSTGIGHDLARRLTFADYTVVATARDPETLKGITAALILPLDVTNQESVDNAVNLTIQQFGKIDILVNNAGYGLRGVVEEVPAEKVQQIFDVNLFGALRMIRAVTPHMREQGSGRIINISSIAGKLATPVNGIYSATKFALEGLSDSLRLELAPFGIQVILIEPGAIKSRFDETASKLGVMDQIRESSPYKLIYQRNARFASSVRTSESGPEVVTAVIMQAMEARKPKARYLAGVNFAIRMAIIFRDALWDTILNRTYKV
jgi:NAD(P)-dependent dehydrogenase (short-subunit alcohol dehydrogenase family)